MEPPLAGIARKPRADKGIPRTSSLTAWFAQFRAFDSATQRIAIAVLEALRKEPEIVDADQTK